MNRNMNRKKIVMLLALVALVGTVAIALLGGGSLVAAESAQQVQSEIRVHGSRDAATPLVDGARATLVTRDSGASFTFQTLDLQPGHVYTVWFVALNAPQNCATTPCTPADILSNTQATQADVVYAAGHVAGASGRATFAGSIPAGTLENSWFDNGFTNPRGAEIHLVLNDHGPAIPDLLSNMIHTYRGGCTDESLPPPFPATAKADGIPGPNTCQLYQFAIFQQ